MKILQLNPAFYPAFAYGGTVNVSYNLSKALAKRGHGVTVFTSDTIDKYTRQKDLYIEHEGIKIHYFRNVSNLLAWKRYLLYPGLVRALRNHIQEFDIVHLHGTRNFQNIVAVHYAKKYNVPYVLQAHGSLPFLQKRKLKKTFDLFFGNNILKNASKVIALNETEASQYRKMGVDINKIEIIPNFIDTSEYNNRPEKGRFKTTHSIANEDKIILYVGRIHKSKGIDLLLKSYSILSTKIPNSKLVIVGPDDGFQNELEELCSKLGLRGKVLFTGFVDKDAKMAAYIDSDIFVTPRFSGFPMTFLEASVFGLPIITTTDGDNLNWINDNIGYIVRSDCNELSSAISTILDNDFLRKCFSEEAKRLVETTFSMDVIMITIESIYQECIKLNEKG